jgi:hypothetical protein
MMLPARGKIAIGAALLCSAGVSVAVGSMLSRAHGHLAEELSKARADGMPLEVSDIKPAVSVPDDENAALLYRDAASYFQRHELSGSENFALDRVLTGKGSKKDVETANDAVEKRAPFVAILAEAAKKRGCDFHFDYEHSPVFQNLAFGDVGKLCQLLCARAFAQARRGDYASAFGSLRLSSKVTRDIITNGAQSPLLFRTREDETLRVLDHIVDEHSNDEVLIQRALAFAKELPPLDDLRRDIGVEAVLARVAIRRFTGMTTQEFQDIESATVAPDKGFLVWLRSPWFSSAIEARTLQYFRELYESFPKDQMAYYTIGGKQDNLMAACDADGSIANSYNRVFAPRFFQSYAFNIKGETHRRLTTIALDLLQRRKTTGTLPEKLPDYGAASIDPYCGKPFHYRRHGQGFTLYSVSIDGIDNGGKNAKGGGQDLTVTFR